MKLGVKTFKNETFLKNFENLADFFEIQAIQTNDYDFLKKFSKTMIIHAEHKGWGINPADKNMYKKNLDSINFARNLADKTHAKKIILHPGYLKDKNCTKNRALDFIRSIGDKRIIIENLISPKGLCATPEEMKELMKSTGLSFCFDLSHAILSAKYLGFDNKKIIKKFFKLKPSHFHISGKDLNSDIDNHYSFADKKSNIPIKEILKLFPKDAEITLEVTTDVKKTMEDLIIIREMTKEIS